MQQKPLVSIFVHTRNSKRTIKEHLESIKNQSYGNIEIIAVDNNSTDGTLAAEKQYSDKVYTFGPERSAQRNFAAKKARGEFFLIPDSDMILGKDVIKECVKLIIKNKGIRAIIVPERSKGYGFWSQCKILERSFYEKIDWLEAARFFPKKIFEEVGGYDEFNTGTEDYDLSQRIARLYGRNSIGRINEYIIHDEGEISLLGILKKKFYYSKNLHIYKLANKKEFNIQANLFYRFNLFFSNPKRLFKNPLLGIGMLFMKSCEFVTGGLGFTKALIVK